MSVDANGVFPYQKFHEANFDRKLKRRVSNQFNTCRPDTLFISDQEVESTDLKSLPGGSTVFGGVHLLATE
jgi:hypothetical protein